MFTNNDNKMIRTISGTIVTFCNLTPAAVKFFARYDVLVSTICPRKISSPTVIKHAVHGRHICCDISF